MCKLAVLKLQRSIVFPLIYSTTKVTVNPEKNTCSLHMPQSRKEDRIWYIWPSIAPYKRSCDVTQNVCILNFALVFVNHYVIIYLL